jgi:hypothetical protein
MDDLTKAARERAMDKVRKLLALAGDKCNEHEAANAASQAEKLMRHYQIDSSEVTMKELEQDESFERGTENVSFEDIAGHRPKQAPGWVGVIAIGCGEAFTCKVDLVDTPEGLKVRFSGYSMDVMLCKWVYRFLCETVFRISKESTKGLGMSAAKSFRAGAASMLQKRLYALKAERDAENKDQAAHGAGTGLVIYDRKQERVSEMYGETKKKEQNGTVSDRAAFHAGVAAASKINIPTNRPLEGSKDNARLS